MKNTHDFKKHHRWLLGSINDDTWGSVWQVRKAVRQLMRAWAVAGRREYGTSSIKYYCNDVRDLDIVNRSN